MHRADFMESMLPGQPLLGVCGGGVGPKEKRLLSASPEQGFQFLLFGATKLKFS